MSTSTRGNVETVLMGHGDHVVGALTMWSLSGVEVRALAREAKEHGDSELADTCDRALCGRCRALKVERATLRLRMEAIGLGHAVPRDPSPGALLARACQAAKSQSQGRGVVFDKVVDDSEKVVFALSDRSRDTRAASVRYEQRVRIAVNKSTGSVLLEDEEDLTLLQVAALYRHARDFAGTEDLSAVLVNAMNGRTNDPLLNAVNLRGNAGGVYFVPGAGLDQLDLLQAFVNNECGGSEMTVWRVTGSAAHLEQAAKAASRAFSQRLATLRKDVAEFTEKLRTDANEAEQSAFDSGLALRREKYEQLAAQVDAYAEVLGMERDRLLAAIGDANAALRAAVLGDA